MIGSSTPPTTTISQPTTTKGLTLLESPRWSLDHSNLNATLHQSSSWFFPVHPASPLSKVHTSDTRVLSKRRSLTVCLAADASLIRPCDVPRECSNPGLLTRSRKKMADTSRSASRWSDGGLIGHYSDPDRLKSLFTRAAEVHVLGDFQGHLSRCTQPEFHIGYLSPRSRLARQSTSCSPYLV